MLREQSNLDPQVPVFIPFRFNNNNCIFDLQEEVQYKKRYTLFKNLNLPTFP